MNTELQLILEALSQATDSASEVAVWWLIIDGLKCIIPALAVVYVVVKLAHIIRLYCAEDSASITLVKELANKHDVDIYNSLGNISRVSIKPLREKLGL